MISQGFSMGFLLRIPLFLLLFLFLYAGTGPQKAFGKMPFSLRDGGSPNRVSVRPEIDPPILTKDSAFIRDAQAAVEALYNLQYESAEARLQAWKKKHPHHPIWPFWKGLKIWWQILPDLQNHSLDARLFKQLEAAADSAEQILRRSPNHRDALLVKALSHGLSARHKANRGQWFSSFNHGRHALKALKRLEKVAPALPDLKFGRGLLNYYSAYLPDAYPVVRPFAWMLPKGSRQKGLNQLEVAAEESIYLQPEAIYFLGKIYMNHEKNHRKAQPYFRRLLNRYPRNPYYARQYVRVLVRADQHQQALETIERLSKRTDMPYQKVMWEELLAWKGKILFQRGRMERAQRILQDSYIIATSANLAGGVNRPFHIMAGYYLGRVYQKQDKPGQALNYYEAVADAKTENHYSRLAKKRAEELRKSI